MTINGLGKLKYVYAGVRPRYLSISFRSSIKHEKEYRAYKEDKPIYECIGIVPMTFLVSCAFSLLIKSFKVELKSREVELIY